MNDNCIAVFVTILRSNFVFSPSSAFASFFSPRRNLLRFLQLKPAFWVLGWLSPRPISTCQLHALLHFHLMPIYLVLSKGSYFTGISHLEGGFALRCLQRLSLPDLATLPWDWFPTGSPAVRPSRSSRTKDSSSQISSACAG